MSLVLSDDAVDNQPESASERVHHHKLFHARRDTRNPEDIAQAYERHDVTPQVDDALSPVDMVGRIVFGALFHMGQRNDVGLVPHANLKPVDDGKRERQPYGDDCPLARRALQ